MTNAILSFNAPLPPPRLRQSVLAFLSSPTPSVPSSAFTKILMLSPSMCSLPCVQYISSIKQKALILTPTRKPAYHMRPSVSLLIRTPDNVSNPLLGWRPRYQPWKCHNLISFNLEPWNLTLALIATPQPTNDCSSHNPQNNRLPLNIQHNCSRSPPTRYPSPTNWSHTPSNPCPTSNSRNNHNRHDNTIQLHRN